MTGLKHSHWRHSYASAIGFLLFFAVAGLAAGESQDSVFNPAYYQVEHLNQGLATADTPVNLQTPQSALENFMLSSREQNFSRAAHSLNFNLIPEAQRAERAPELTRKLYSIVQQALWIEWDNVPDTPAAQVDMQFAGNNRVALQPRRSIAVGSVALGNRNVGLRLARVRAGEQPPVWVISAQTVENIPALYDEYGPSILDRRLPGWAKLRLAGNVPLWEWGMLAVFAALSLALGWGLQKLALRALRRRRGGLSTGLAQALSGPLATLIGLSLFSLSSSLLLSLSGPFASFLSPTLSLLTVAAGTWAAISVVTFFSEHLRKQYTHELEDADGPRIRQLLTQVSVARRVLLFVALLLGVGIGLSQIDLFETVGLSLLASAGALSLILGISAHTVLGNIMAGIQIALTQLVSIGDNVRFDGEWGYVEQITYTYLTIRTWDQRRLIVPLKRLLQEPLENWSKTREHLVAPVYVYADYTTDVSKFRKKYNELLRADSDYSGELEPNMQVVQLTETSMQIRALCPAVDADAAWRLHCRMREELVAWLQSQGQGEYLPRHRWQKQGSTKPAG